MLQFLMIVLLIGKGASESNICDKRCNSDDFEIKEFPETSEDLRKFCKLSIEIMECEVQHKEFCQELDLQNIQMGYKLLAAVREICAENTLLHAAVVDNLKCFSKLINTNFNRGCYMDDPRLDRIQKFAEVLMEEGLVALTDYGNDSSKLHECINLMNIFACQSLKVEDECGKIAMYVYAEILQKVMPGVIPSCEESYHLLPPVIRLLKIEENEASLSDVFRSKK